MGIQSKTTLKSYFQTGDIPTETQYADLIDSFIHAGEATTQVVQGDISASSFIAENHITASGNISASLTGSFGALLVDSFNDINLQGDLTASGDVNITGNITVAQVTSSGGFSDINLQGDLTASGHISSTGTGSFAYIMTEEYVAHNGDVNTAIRFTDNKISFDAGGMTFFAVHDDGSAPFTATVNGGGNQINFKVNDKDNNILFKTDSVNRRVGINKNDPEVDLEVVGHVSASGDITGRSLKGVISVSSSILQSTSASFTELTFGGTHITTTGTEINYLDGVGSNVKEAYNAVDFNTGTGRLTFTELDGGSDIIDLPIGTSDSPTFTGISLTKETTSHVFGGNSTISSQRNFSLTTTFPSMLSLQTLLIGKFALDSLESGDTIVASCKIAGVQIIATHDAVSDGTLILHGVNLSGNAIAGGSTTINVTLL